MNFKYLLDQKYFGQMKGDGDEYFDLFYSNRRCCIQRIVHSVPSKWALNALSDPTVDSLLIFPDGNCVINETPWLSLNERLFKIFWKSAGSTTQSCQSSNCMQIATVAYIG